MLTFLMVLLVIIIFGVAMAILSMMISVLPIILIVTSLFVMDYLLIKSLCKRRKEKKGKA